MFAQSPKDKEKGERAMKKMNLTNRPDVVAV